MTKREPVSSDTVLKAKGLFATIVSLTEGPQEAIAILTIMHILLWADNHKPTTTVDEMLEEYCGDFKHNINKLGIHETLQ